MVAYILPQTARQCLSYYDPHAEGRALLNLLGGFIRGARGVMRNAKERYPGAKRPLRADDLEAHVRGDRTYAVEPVVRGQSQVAVIDIDERFEERLPALRGAAEKLQLQYCCVLTTGSSAGRGKFVVFLRSPRPRASVAAFAASILDECRRHACWGSETTGTVETRPTAGGDGGLIRIGGRSMKPGALLDKLITLDGEVTNFTETLGRVLSAENRGRVRMKSIVVAPAAPSTESRFMRRLRTKGLHHDSDVPNYRFRALKRLAHDVLARGPMGAEARFWSLVKEIITKSDPDLTHSIQKDAAKAYEHAGRGENGSLGNAPPRRRSRLPNETSLKAKDVDTVVAIRWYLARKNLVNEHVFSIPTRELAKALGLSQRGARDRLRRAVAAGVLVCHHPGIAGSSRFARAAIYGLVHDGETPEQVRKIGDDHGQVREQRTTAEARKACAPLFRQKLLLRKARRRTPLVTTSKPDVMHPASTNNRNGHVGLSFSESER